ncbi:protein phosphatase 2C domain-containing protein [Colwellia sp. E2M01]|uniref:PP2C family protein-serine/threonine phosphatase n=1 Tax=Colwellia sp. E2M01 TaxID=2841561 RepID=UPI001C080BB3|nr:protein phosphatase 2C domain-containing protein [Colwellia sp. E2M01]MBU2870482.1 protein phosphatase 2C domain-containing protein [Colwellia sp. E2M01]
MYLSSHAQTHRGTVRQINEDAFLELPQQGIWVVADGMGGHAAGDVASQLVIDNIQDAVENKTSDEVSTDMLIKILQQCNTQLQEMSENQFLGKVVGTTVVILWVKKNDYSLLWAGDSRGYLLRNNKLQQITKDHSQVNDMVDEGILKAEEAESHPLANVITRAVGVDNNLNVEVKTAPLLVGDVFLLCSDGLNKEVSDSEIERALQPGNIIDAGMALMHASLVRNARDNVTCIIAKNNQREINVINNEHDATIPVFI